MEQNYYNTLGVPFDATQEEIRSAYFEAAKRYHPDANTSESSNEQFIEIQEAYDILVNSYRRKQFDDTLPDVDKVKPSVKMNILYSEPPYPLLKEEQLLYVLLELYGEKPSNETILPRIHICLIVDTSNSMRGSRLDMVRANVQHLIQKLNPNDHISIVSFSDRAEVILEPTLVKEYYQIESSLTKFSAGGATEIFHGLKMGCDLINSVQQKDVLRQLILITDGHTYGDESACLMLAEEARNSGIEINALGIGDEWNDAFLDKLAAISGGNAVYVRGSESLYQFIDEKVRALNFICARQVNCFFELGEGVELSYAFRIYPEITPMVPNSPLPLGHLECGKKTSVILEFKVKPGEVDSPLLNIAKGKIFMDIPSISIRISRLDFNIHCKWRINEQTYRPPQEILQAMSKLTLYRLQEKAKIDVAKGNIKKATQRLENLASHLIAQGNKEFAESVLLEAAHIKNKQHYSKEGDKKIKYGTRSLLMLPDPKKGQDDYLP